MLPPRSAVVQDGTDELTSYIVSFVRVCQDNCLLYDDAYPDVSIIELLPS